MKKTSKLNDEDILRIMREEWNLLRRQLAEEIDVTLTADVGKGKKKQEAIVISPELKIRHKKSGFRYTIDSVGPRDCILRTPEGKTFLVDANTLENEYELD